MGHLVRPPHSGLDDFRLSNYCNPTGPLKAPSVVLALTLLLPYVSSEAPVTASRPTPLAVTVELRTRMTEVPPATRPTLFPITMVWSTNSATLELAAWRVMPFVALPET